MLDQSLLNIEFLGNTSIAYFIAGIWFLGTIIALKAFQLIILAKIKTLARKTKTDFDDVLAEVLGQIKPFSYFIIALYAGLANLSVAEIVTSIMTALLTVTLVYEVVRACERMIHYAARKYLDRSSQTEEERARNESMANLIQIVARIALWILGILTILSNLGINVVSIIASLGVGGIAIALAAQSLFEDLFSAIAIYFDKPFKVGDFIVIGEHMGVVEKIGMKTTRLRTLQGEELVIPNKELTSTRVQNFKQMERRRVVLEFGVVYGTPQTKLESIPDMVKEIVVGLSTTDFDRCHLKSFGSSALEFETVYYVNSADYNQHMDILQQVHHAIYSRFTQAKIEFALPTQTVFVRKG